MTGTVLMWAMCAGVLTIAWGATVRSASRVVAAVERQDRERQEIHWARQTALVARPDTCPSDVIDWLSQPIVPAEQADTLPLLCFQRCAAAAGHDPARAQQVLLRRFQKGRRAS